MKKSLSLLVMICGCTILANAQQAAAKQPAPAPQKKLATSNMPLQRVQHKPIPRNTDTDISNGERKKPVSPNLVAKKKAKAQPADAPLKAQE
ncbi:MAG TPA: hypothetical protein PKC39_06070 [Ferruginibacter sp.]|nr:hypothetical protein [Ferruginibacter sp.]HMP20508.1 hypothetical protein [Ferruginibacter sp.]